ncbi:TPP-dependent acetoin dehydrogenase complex, E1 protein subunit beta [Novosphingobium endophyticum]|uniref:TPP-dependent acetoin dehydrogenase complex, E1 protein subunit beta n=1 Tax=Novosphingobium endophyticum TaxID=1955250 RepID=A0A916TS20_9SPHN|nr:pyruvate dehydrogenase complex E1 component subunit beta [Novosphingobium endophyticum]GGC00589.1 TPP-dependent acetoin dehydrogenase complex, E1 protein subunit beta [Novosphingobium endophyticum]
MTTGTENRADERTVTCADAVQEALAEAMERDDSVIVLGEDVADLQGGGIRGCTQGLSTRFGDGRVRSTPISEQAIIGAAVGAAIAGMRPVAEIMLMNFITVAMDQIVNHAAKTRYMSGGQASVPLTIRTMTGAGAGTGGQHSDMLEAWLAHVPGLKIAVPSTAADYKALLTACIFDDNPCIFIENTLQLKSKGSLIANEKPLPLGKARIVRSGSDVTLISYGRPMIDAEKVAASLGDQGLSVELIDLRTIVPFDEETILNSVAKTGRAVVLHEAVKRFGVGAEIASRIHEELFADLKKPVLRLGMPYTPVPFSSALEKPILWNADKIEAAIRSLM